MPPAWIYLLNQAPTCCRHRDIMSCHARDLQTLATQHLLIVERNKGILSGRQACYGAEKAPLSCAAVPETLSVHFDERGHATMMMGYRAKRGVREKHSPKLGPMLKLAQKRWQQAFLM